jgi:hypothetical protein
MICPLQGRKQYTIFYYLNYNMAISQKYGRTYHYPFSPGTTSDDRIAHEYWNDLNNIKKLVHTEKLDGENNCLSRYGVFARSHAAPTISPWTNHLRQFWGSIKNELGTLEIFLENLYAVHSLEYRALEHYYYVFAIREGERWLSWEETKFYAALIDLPVVPELAIWPEPGEEDTFIKQFQALVSGPGLFDPYDIHTGLPATMEGIVSRNAEAYALDDFSQNVFKYVRKGHVKTDQHWTRNWKKATIKRGGSHVAYS